jgi:hypothetical protein
MWIFLISVVDPSFYSSSSDSYSDNGNIYTKPKKKHKDSKQIKSPAPVLSNEKASYPTEETCKIRHHHL